MVDARWDTRIIVLSCLCFKSARRITPSLMLSTLLVGSSSRMMSGEVMNAHTRPTFCFVPFDILRMRRAGSSSKYSTSWFMRVRSRSFFMRAMNSRKAAPVISSMQAISPGR